MLRHMELLFLGSRGKVRAVEVDTGRDVWTTSLPGTAYEVVTVLADRGRIFAGCRGKLFRLDPADGRILWSNPLTGLGYEVVTLAAMGVGGSQAVMAVKVSDG